MKTQLEEASKRFKNENHQVYDNPICTDMLEHFGKDFLNWQSEQSNQAIQELVQATKELMRFSAEMKYVMGSALANPENFIKAVENLETLLIQKHKPKQ